MAQDYLSLIRPLWATAVTDAPSRPSCKLEDGKFVFTINGNRDNWAALIAACGVPSNAAQVIENSTIKLSWDSVADQLLAPDGPVAKLKQNYQLRHPQLHMARLVQRAIEMKDTAIIEAGTGTGKGFAYLLPALAMGKRVIVSTSNKALQAQLVEKDIPFLFKIFPGKTVAVAQGKSNYACRLKCSSVNANLSDDFKAWLDTTESGNLEAITFPLSAKERAEVNVDDECPGRKNCVYGDDPDQHCFYYAARDARANADVIVTNHALLCLHMVYPMAGILPEAGVIVVDEAHKLADYARNALGDNLLYGQVVKAVNTAIRNGLDQEDAEILESMLGSYQREVLAYIRNKTEKQIGILPEDIFMVGLELAQALIRASLLIWNEEYIPSDDAQRRAQRFARRIMDVADKLRAVSMPTRPGSVRWIDLDKEGNVSFTVAPHDVAPFLSQLIGYDVTTQTVVDYTHCTRCNRKLTAQAVHILDGLPYGPDCIKHIDPVGDADLVSLEAWLGADHSAAPVIKPSYKRGVIFTSATLAAPDFEMFKRECGIHEAMELRVESPFDYKKNALLYIPKGAAPAPNDLSYPTWMLSQLEELVTASQGSAFLLFTSYKNLQLARENLEPLFSRHYPCFVQGDGLGKQEMARRFDAAGNGVLFGTKSFFEGVSIEGESLRLVTVDKMPFPVPSPMLQAIKHELTRQAKEVLKLPARDVEWYPFNTLDVPAMIIDLLQAFGRLIRTNEDYGTVAILDPRLRTSRYGRDTVLPALPPARRVDDIAMAVDLFATRRLPRYEPAVNVKAPRPRVEVEDFTLLEELAF